MLHFLFSKADYGLEPWADYYYSYFKGVGYAVEIPLANLKPEYLCS